MQAAAQIQRPNRNGVDQGQDHGPLQLKRVGGSVAGQTEIPSIVHEVLRSPGQPLDAATRAFMEPRFGHDFSKVKVHTDDMASDSARALHSRAYTAGSHIVFARSDSMTSDPSLLAHELTHTLQQDRGPALIQRQPGPQDASPWKDDVRAARYRGQVMAQRLRTHTKLSKEARQKINSELAMFEGAAKEAYLAEVKPALFAVVEIEMPAMDLSKPFKTPKPIPLMLDPADLCGGQKCYTDADLKAFLDEQQPKETPQEKRAIDDQLDELRKKTADWGGYQAFAVKLLEMALREKQLHDPRAVAIAIQNPILVHYRAWLMAIDKRRMERWNSGELSFFEEQKLRGNGDPPDKSWFAEDGNHHGPYAIQELRGSLARDERADVSAVDHVYYQVREYRQRTDPHEIEMAGLAGDIVNALVVLATGIGENVNAGEPGPTAEPTVRPAEPPPPEPEPYKVIQGGGQGDSVPAGKLVDSDKLATAPGTDPSPTPPQKGVNFGKPAVNDNDAVQQEQQQRVASGGADPKRPQAVRRVVPSPPPKPQAPARTTQTSGGGPTSPPRRGNPNNPIQEKTVKPTQPPEDTQSVRPTAPGQNPEPRSTAIGNFAERNFNQLPELLARYRISSKQPISEPVPAGATKYRIPGWQGTQPGARGPEIDALDRQAGTIIEIKPHNQYEQGRAEAEGYADIMDRVEPLPPEKLPGGGTAPRHWEPKCITYDGEAVGQLYDLLFGP
ncbi:MAG: DUF4157 domain-containing protein [Steroidobacteraceae bacterium]